MTKSERFLTSIQVDVYNTWWKIKGKKYGGRAGNVKVYYDLIELSRDEFAAMVKMIKILSKEIKQDK